MPRLSRSAIAWRLWVVPSDWREGGPFDVALDNLRNRASRTAFLTRPRHAIRFVYTPKHCSWLNEIERWFSKLARAVLRRGSFPSLDDLRQRVIDYIRYYNIVDAKPHRWRISADDLLAKFRIGISDPMN